MFTLVYRQVQASFQFSLFSISFLKVLCLHWLLPNFCIVSVGRILLHRNITFLRDVTDLKGFFQPVQKFVGKLTDILKSTCNQSIN